MHEKEKWLEARQSTRLVLLKEEIDGPNRRHLPEKYICIHMYTYEYVYTYMYTYVYTYMYTYVYTYMYTYVVQCSYLSTPFL